MPKPNKNEAKQDFLKRCTGQLVGEEGQSADQAYAVCNAYWNDAHSQRAALSLAAPVELQPDEGEAKPSGFLITAYTGQIVERCYGNLVIATQGIKTKTKLPVLREHQRDRVVGFATKSWKDGGQLFLQGEYSAKTKDGQEVRDLGDEGFPWEASIGVWPKKVKVLESDKETAKVNGQELVGPLEIWLESEVREVSFVALGADDQTAAINFAQEGPVVKVQIERGQPQENKEEVPMAMNLSQLETDAPELLAEIRNQARAAGLTAGQESGCQAERARAVEILEAAGVTGLILAVVQDGREVKEALKAFLAHQGQVKTEALSALVSQAPPQVGTDPPQVETHTEMSADVSIETRAKAEWDKDAKLQREFGGIFEAYLAGKRADEAGLVKQITKG